MATITIKPAEVLVVKVTPVVSGGGIIEGGGGASDIGDLTSVSISNPDNGDVLVYNGASWVNTPGIATESYVDNAVSTVQSQVTTNNTAISTLQTSVTNNTSSISSLQSADNELQSNIDAEATARIAADSDLQAQIDAEEAARISADSTLQDNIDTEEAAREDADIGLTELINTETSARTTAISGLQTNLAGEANRALAAESVLQDNIDAEASARANADTALQANIDSLTSVDLADTPENYGNAGQVLVVNNDTDGLVWADNGAGSVAGVSSLNGLDGVLTVSSTDTDLLTVGTSGSDTIQLNPVLPRTMLEDVKNVSGGALTKGMALHVTGSTGVGEAEVIKADASSGLAAHLVLNEDLPNNLDVGKAVAIGFINNVSVPDTTNFQAGTEVYLGDDGAFTHIKPTGTSIVQYLGVVLNASTTSGPGTISGIIQNLGVENQLPNLTNGSVWVGDSNGVPSEVELTTTNIPEGSNQYYTDSKVDGRISNASLEDIGDVTISGVSNGQALVWNDTAWVNGDVASSSGLTAVSDDTAPSLGGALTAGYDINVSDGEVVRFGGSTSTLPTIGANITSQEFNLSSNTSNYNININASGGDVNLTGTNINLSGSVSSGNLISTNTLSTGTLTAASLSVTNDITVSGTVDGRNVYEDGAKLDTLNFGADVNVSAPSGGNQGNYAIVWDGTAGEWQQKIPTLPSLNFIETVNTGTTNPGAILTYNGNTEKWEASTNNGGVVIGDVSDALTALNNIEGLLKYDATTTKLYNTTNDTTKGYLDLGETNSFFGINNTGFNVDKNSPGSITLSVDTGPTTPETSFDAFVISGTTTANTATTTISEGNTLTFGIGSNSATLTPSVLTADVDINLPASSGTLALTSDITDTFLVNETSPALGADLNAGAHDINFDTGSAVNFVTDSTQSRIDFYSDTSTLRILSGHPIGNTNLSLYCGASGDVNIGPLGDQIVVNASSLDLQSKDLLFGNGSYDVTLQAPSLAANATVTLPSSTGTLALTSDVPSSINDLTDTPVSLGAAGQVLAVDSTGNATEWVTPSGGSGGASEVANETGTTRTLTSTDAGKYIVCTNASAITVNVNTGVFSVGDEILIEQGGAGQVTIAGTATVRTSSANTKKTAEQYAVVGLKCVATDTFTLTGERELV